MRCAACLILNCFGVHLRFVQIDGVALWLRVALAATECRTAMGCR